MRPRLTLVAAVFLLLLSPAPSSTCEWDYPIWIQRSASADALYRFTKGDKAGYIDQAGKIVIAAVLPHWGGNFGGEFHDGLLQISGSDGIYVDRSGTNVIDKALHQGWEFSDGLAAAMKTPDGKWGFINTKGEFVISPRFDSPASGYVSSFENGFAAIEVNGKYGYIDHSGEFIIPPRFLLGDSFHDGMARVIADGPCFYKNERPCSSPMTLPRSTNSTESTPECKFTFIDTSGRILSQERFDAAGSFAEGLAPIRIEKHWGYIGKSGNLAIPAKFDSAESFSDGLAAVSVNDRFGYIDHTGSFVVAPQFASAEGFADQRAVVGDEEETYWYIDTQGKQAFPERFDTASPFFKGLAHVELIPKDPNSKVGEARSQRIFAYINPSGRHVFTYKP